MRSLLAAFALSCLTALWWRRRKRELVNRVTSGWRW